MPLREVIRTNEAVGPTEVRRVNQARLIPIYADGTARDLTRALTAVGEIVMENPAPAGIRVEIGGGGEEMARSFRDLAFAFIPALLLVHMMLAAEFESFVHPLTVLLRTPPAAGGARL